MLEEFKPGLHRGAPLEKNHGTKSHKKSCGGRLKMYYNIIQYNTIKHNTIYKHPALITLPPEPFLAGSFSGRSLAGLNRPNTYYSSDRGDPR